jgi:membrane protein DedA with SNARE-associated domain
MDYWQFQIANFASAFLWAFVLLTMGDVVGKIIEWVWP